MNRGEIVEVIWYYTDMSGSKQRPAVVFQADFLNGLIDDTILVQITSTRHGIPGTEVLLDPAVETNSRLIKVCVASSTNLTTYDQSLVTRTVGSPSYPVMLQINAFPKVILELRRKLHPP